MKLVTPLGIVYVDGLPVDLASRPSTYGDWDDPARRHANGVASRSDIKGHPCELALMSDAERKAVWRASRAARARALAAGERAEDL